MVSTYRSCSLVIAIAVFWSCSGGALSAKQASTTNRQYPLQYITVYATPAKSPLTDMAARTIILNREEIEQSVARNTMELLASVEGLFLPSANTGQPLFPTLTMRGLGSGNLGVNTPVIFLLNGHNISGTFNIGNAFAGLSAIPLSIIERVEVIKGPYSSIYGSGGLAGVINIVTRKKPERPTEGRAEFTVGSHGYTNGEAYLGFQTGNVHVLGWAGRSHGDERKFFSPDLTPFWGYFQDGFSDTFRTGLSVQWEPSGGGRVHFMWNHFERDSSLVRGRKLGNDHFNTDLVQFTFERPLGERSSLRLLADFAHVQNRELDDYGHGVRPPASPSDPDPAAASEDYGPVRQGGLKLLFNWRPSSHLVTAGVEFRRRDADFNRWAGDHEILVGFHQGRQDIYSCFVEASLSWGNLKVTPSLRYDYWQTSATYSSEETILVPFNPPRTKPGNLIPIHPESIYGSSRDESLTPKLRLAYHLGPGLKLRGAVGQTFRAPSPMEKYYFSYSTAQRFVTNPDLRAEQVTSIEAGLDWNAPSGRFSSSTTIYYSWVEDRNELVPVPNQVNARQYYNLDSRVYGLEVAGQVKLTKELSFSANVSLTSSTYYGGTLDGMDVPLVPDYLVNAALDYRRGGFSAHLGARFIGRRTIVNDPSAEGLAPVSKSAEPIALVDASLLYKFPTKCWGTPFVKVWGTNLLGQEYTSEALFVYLEPLGMPNFETLAEGRSFFVMVGLEF